MPAQAPPAAASAAAAWLDFSRKRTTALLFLVLALIYMSVGQGGAPTRRLGSPDPKRARAGASSASARAGAAGAAGGGKGRGFPVWVPPKLPGVPNGYRCTVPPGRRLAIAQFKWWHSEVFGTILEYAKACDHGVVIYYNPMLHQTQAARMYEKLFSSSDIEIREPTRLFKDHAQYDALIFPTPDDEIDEGFRFENQHRAIYMAHLTHPKFLHRWHTLRLYMTPLAGYPYAIPVWAGSRTPVPPAKRTRTIAMVGTVHDGHNYDISHIADFFRRVLADGWEAIVFTRHWGTEVKRPDGLQILTDVGTEDMYERLRHVAFVLVFPSDNSWYNTDRITGALPLALSCVTPVITTTMFATLYGHTAEGNGVVSADGAEAMAAAVSSYGGPARAGGGAPAGGDAPPPPPQPMGEGLAEYAALFDAMLAYRTKLIANNHAVIEMVLRGVPAIAESVAIEAAERGDTADYLAQSGFAPILPLAPGINKRLKPELGC